MDGMTYCPITSRSNPLARKLDGILRQKKAREESSLFALEGRRLCADALAAGIRPRLLFLTQSAWERSSGGLEELAAAAGQVAWLSEELSRRVGDTQSPQGVFALCETPSLAPEQVPRSEKGSYLLLHRVRDPGNLGSILRAAAALGASGAFLCDCAEVFSPKTLRASMGGVWRLPLGVCGDMAQTLSRLQRSGITCLAAALEQGASGPERLREPGGKAILIGNEGDGLPRELTAACDGVVMLPMRGGSDSLGAAMAAGILLWEMLK